MENTRFIYPGQPFIGEGVLRTILSFNNEPNDKGTSSVLEREHAQIAVGVTMVALESLVKTKLHNIDENEPKLLEDLFLKTVPDSSTNHPALGLWHELKILRNQIIHSGYFEKNILGGKISKATQTRIGFKFTCSHIDFKNERTKKYRLTINPLNVSRYEAFVTLLFFYWYGKVTETWSSNVPLNRIYVDSRFNHDIIGKWINAGRFHHLVGGGNEYVNLIGFLSNRLNPISKKQIYKSALSDLDIDLNKSANTALSILKMFETGSITL